MGVLEEGSDTKREMKGKRRVEPRVGIYHVRWPSTLLFQRRSGPAPLSLHGGLLSTTWKSLTDIYPKSSRNVEGQESPAVQDS